MMFKMLGNVYATMFTAAMLFFLQCGEVNELVNSLREKVASSEVSTEKGLSLLELKNHLMLR